MTVSVRLATWVTIAGLIMAGGTACSNQGEGERCDQANNNDDCNAGLVCVPRGGTNRFLCCPPPPAAPSVPQCVEDLNLPVGDAGAEAGEPVGEGGQTDGTVPDAATAEPDSFAAEADAAPDTALESVEASAPDVSADAPVTIDGSLESTTPAEAGADTDASGG